MPVHMRLHKPRSRRGGRALRTTEQGRLSGALRGGKSEGRRRWRRARQRRV